MNILISTFNFYCLEVVFSLIIQIYFKNLYKININTKKSFFSSPLSHSIYLLFLSPRAKEKKIPKKIPHPTHLSLSLSLFLSLPLSSDCVKRTKTQTPTTPPTHTHTLSPFPTCQLHNSQKSKFQNPSLYLSLLFPLLPVSAGQQPKTKTIPKTVRFLLRKMNSKLGI